MTKSFYRLFILSQNSYGEFCVDKEVPPNLEYAYHLGQSLLSAENVYGYIIVKVSGDTWQVVNETVYGCEYTVYEHNGVVHVKEGKDKIVLV